MKWFAILVQALLMSGCAMPGSVQRIAVGYNNAVANTTDELTLLNVIRAQNGYPLHYTSVSRLSGSITLKVSGGFNSQLKDKGATDTNMTQTQTSGVVSTVTKAVTSGGTGYTPSLGGEVDTNPSFDLDVNDTQQFRQGMMSSIEPDTVLGMIDQGYDRDELLYLTIGKVEFSLKTELPWYAGKKGDAVLRIDNNGTSAGSGQIATLLQCYSFKMESQPPTELAPLSRVTSGAGPGKTSISMQDLALLDGTKLDLSGKPIGAPAGDGDVKVVRPSSKKVGRFQWSGNVPTSGCPFKAVTVTDHGQAFEVYQPVGIPGTNTFVGNSKVLVEAKDSSPTKPIFTYVDVNFDLTIRSPEAVIKFIGGCLKPKTEKVDACVVNGRTLFEFNRGDGAPNDIKATFGDTRYYIDATTDDGKSSMRTLGLIENLIDLHKASADKPVTAPVRIVS